jgi:hypothetical protein
MTSDQICLYMCVCDLLKVALPFIAVVTKAGNSTKSWATWSQFTLSPFVILTFISLLSIHRRVPLPSICFDYSFVWFPHLPNTYLYIYSSSLSWFWSSLRLVKGAKYEKVYNNVSFMWHFKIWLNMCSDPWLNKEVNFRKNKIRTAVECGA